MVDFDMMEDFNLEENGSMENPSLFKCLSTLKKSNKIGNLSTAKNLIEDSSANLSTVKDLHATQVLNNIEKQGGHFGVSKCSMTNKL